MINDVFIVDDEQSVRLSLLSLLRGEGYHVDAFADIGGFEKAVDRDACGILLLDIAIPGEDGLTFLERCFSAYPHLDVIMITGEATIDRAVAATRLGADDFLEKPLEPARLLLSVRNLAERLALKQQVAEKQRGEESRYELIGESESMQALKLQIDQVAPADSTVLVTGENGTGKELVAYRLWAHSRRREQPYVKVNCAALPNDLAEAELFGYRKGAFTGADRNRAGKFKAADRGTIFLDEIGDLSGSIQAKLLRILETGELEPLGADAAETVDTRLIAATNRELPEQIKAGRFREDLFYRLNVVPIRVPPLRERREDIAPLIERFTETLAGTTGLGRKSFTPEAVGLLSGLDYHGNVRELKNIVERCYIMSRGTAIDPDELRRHLGALVEPADSEDHESRNQLTQAVRGFERSFLANQLSRFDGNISELARNLGIDRGNLSRKLKSYGLV